MNWDSLLQLIINGEDVSSQVTNRPIEQLGRRTDYLKALIEVMSAGRALIDADARLDTSVVPGATVYWDPAQQLYAPAIAAVQYSNERGSLADSAYVAGICLSKNSPSYGVVVLSGKHPGLISSANTDEGDLQPGPYFLSAQTPGKLTRTRPFIGIPVLVLMNTDGDALVRPYPKEILEDHVHYRVPLASDNWLDATAIGDKPEGARFYYNLENDDWAAGLFPFVPPEDVYTEVDGVGTTTKVVCTLTGIWWIDPGFDPADYSSTNVYYVRPSALGHRGLVTSLRPWTEDGLIKVVDCLGNPSTSGDLYLLLDLLGQDNDDTEPGYHAFKRIDEAGRLYRGPVVESITSANPTLLVSFEPENGETDGDGRTAGRVILDLNSDNVPRQGPPGLVVLSGALEDVVNDVIPVVTLQRSTLGTASVTYRLDLPYDSAVGNLVAVNNFNVQLMLWVTGKASSYGNSGPIPARLTAKIMTTGTVDEVTLQASAAVAQADNFMKTEVALTSGYANKFVLYELEAPVTATGGQMLMVKILRRTGVNDLFTGDLAIARAVFKLTAV